VKKLSIPVAYLFIVAGFASGQTPVILISIDTLRADQVSAVRTPNIDSFAVHGTLFTEADCQVPLTLPSHTSMLTSTYPFGNQIEENAERVPPGAVTLASVLHGNGYKTAAFIGSVFLERQMGLDTGFDFYDSPFNLPVSANPRAGQERRDGALVLRAARQWLSANSAQPVFAFVHLFDMHKPYPVSYDEQLKYVDRLMGTFKQSLVQLGLWDRALVILVSDHGEGLGDHGEDSHGYFVYESTLHVPLIFHWPAGHWPAGTENHPARVTDPVGLIDVAPTILDLLHLPMPPSFEGNSLFGTHAPVYGESMHAHDAFGWAPLRSLRVGDYKYIEAPRPELYNLRTDPHESTNLYVKGSPKATDLRNQLAKLVARYTPKQYAAVSEISPETRALLDSLGYLAPGPRPAPRGAEADPKDRLAEFRLYEDAWVEIYYRRLDEGIAKLRQLLARDPQNLLARRDLAGAYAEKKDYASARAAYQEVLNAAPEDYVAQYGMGVTDERLGLWKDAKDHLETACRIEPDAQQSRHELNAVMEKLR
jgi:arylsulfatase A-like enzyme